jgi:hypothetical protein
MSVTNESMVFVATVETVGLGCGLGKAKIAVGLGEVDFEGGPGYFYCWKFAPVSASFWKHSSVETSV